MALLGSNGAGKTTTLNAIAGLVPSGARPHRMARRDDFRAAGLRHRQQGSGAVAGRLAAVRRSDRRAESSARRHRARRPLAHRCAVRARLCAVSAAGRAAPAIGRHAVRRRAADAGARPRADERAASADARRAEPRPGARRGRDALRHARPNCTGKASRCCWPSSRSRWRSASPITPMCCRPGASRSKGRRRNWSATNKCGRFIWA